MKDHCKKHQNVSSLRNRILRKLQGGEFLCVYLCAIHECSSRPVKARAQFPLFQESGHAIHIGRFWRAWSKAFFFNQTDKIKNLSIRKLLRLALKQSQMQTPLRRICTTASIKDLVNADKFFVNSNEHSYLRDLVGSRRRTAVELCAHLPHDPWNHARRNESDLQNDAHGRHDCRESVLPCPAPPPTRE